MNDNPVVKEARELLPYCSTHRQTEILEAVIQHRSKKAACEFLGVGRSTIQVVFRRVRVHKQNANQSHHIPDGHKLIGVSTLTKTDEGEPQWIKTKQDVTQALEMMQEARDATLESMPREKSVKKLKASNNEDLLNTYIITDFHLGMKAWREETGDDWDVKIAEQMIVDWFRYAIANSPNAENAILAQLGDFLHWDGVEAVTPASGHILDADTRFQKLIRTSIGVFRRIVRDMLKKYENVYIIHAEGNHDPASSMWLREMFSVFYEEESRVTVEISPDPYYCYEHGKTGLYFHHGHKRKPANIHNVFVAKFRDVFGRTKYSYGHTGHLHHNLMVETNLMQVEQHQTLAAPDAYASRGGWISGRSAKVITYHKEYGEVGRLTVCPEML